MQTYSAIDIAKYFVKKYKEIIKKSVIKYQEA
jgi:hypothetical protein